jgi:hypothetical protein
MRRMTPTANSSRTSRLAFWFRVTEMPRAPDTISTRTLAMRCRSFSLGCAPALAVRN